MQAHATRTRAGPRRGPLGLLVQVVGELVVTAGLVLLLLVVYEVWVTNLFTAQAQHRITDQLDQLWAAQGPLATAADGPRPRDGQGFAKIYLPTIHDEFTVVEGTTQADLAEGPGHYPASPLPGEPGNTAIAGHRVGRGAPFLDLDLVRSCDPIVIETGSAWLVYRVLPHADELPDWAAGRGAAPECRDTRPLTGPYAGVVGQEIVTPTHTEVVAVVPDHPAAVPAPGQELALLTLTTCNPKFSAHQRLVVHAVLAVRYPKDPRRPDLRPTELQGS